MSSSNGEALTVAGLLHHLEQHRRVIEQHITLGTADDRLLWLLRDRQPRTLREIAAELGLEQSTVNRQVNAALARGLLERCREPDRYSYQFVPTDAGITAFQEDLALSLNTYTAALAKLSPADRRTLLELLDRFVAAYGDVAADCAAAPPIIV